MNLKELARPVRIYWDLPEESSDPVFCEKICGDIIAEKALFLGLRGVSPAAGASVRGVIERLRNGKMAVSLTVSSSVFQSFAENPHSYVRGLFIETTSLEEVRAAVKEIGQIENASFGISFGITEENFMEIPDVVSSCLEAGVPQLMFPIQRLRPGGGFYMDAKGRNDLSLKLGKTDHSRLRITIHDPFLWQIFYPGADYHEAGCQAANSMLYISAEYKVYPCPAMPIELGDLRVMPLGEIISSEKKKGLRKALLDPPQGCAACEKVGRCFGGCRGRAFALTGMLDIPDPACK